MKIGGAFINALFMSLATGCNLFGYVLAIFVGVAAFRFFFSLQAGCASLGLRGCG